MSDFLVCDNIQASETNCLIDPCDLSTLFQCVICEKKFLLIP